MHGGTAETGAAAPGFKHGRFSKYLPADLDELFQEAISNPDLIEMSDYIGILEARIKTVFRQLQEGAPAPRWQDLLDAFNQMAGSLLGGDINEANAALERMRNLLEAGRHWDQSWNTIIDTTDSLRKVTDTEIKRKKDLNQMIPVERVVALMGAVGQAVKRHVKDPTEIKAVYGELALLYGTNEVPGKTRGFRVGAGQLAGVIDVESKRQERQEVQAEPEDVEA